MRRSPESYLSLLAAAEIMDLGAGLPASALPTTPRTVSSRARRQGGKQQTEIEAWNAQVDARKAAKKARKAAAQSKEGGAA